MPPKVGLIGAGRWGMNHARIYSELDCELAGIADINPAAKKTAEEFGTKYFKDYTDLLPLVDAVSVVVPTNRHYEVVKKCLEAGKHVLVEKPMTLSSPETKDLIETARKRNLILMGGYLFRFNAAVIELKKQLENAGKIHYISARYMHSDKPPRKDCGVIFNFATHLIDILNFLLDKEPRSVFCKKVNYLSGEREDCALIVLDYGDFLASLEVTWFHPLKKRDMWIIASDEKIYTDFLEQMIVRYPVVTKEGKVTSQKETNVEIHKNEPLRDELDFFCKSIESGTKNASDGEYLITRICEKCLESAEKGKEVRM